MGDVIKFYRAKSVTPDNPAQSDVGRMVEEIMKPLPFHPSELIGAGDLFLAHLWDRGFKIVPVDTSDAPPASDQ